MKETIIIDPASENSEREIDYVERNGLKLAYVILTHGHVDHAWGANALKEKYPSALLLYSEKLSGDLYTSKYFLRLVQSNVTSEFVVKSADIVVSNKTEIRWGAHNIKFVLTPGHSPGSMCIDIDGLLFTGDAIMPAKQYKKAKDYNQEEYFSSVKLINELYPSSTVIYPGHGDSLSLGECGKRE